MSDTRAHLLEVENLSVEFHTRHGRVLAVQDVGFHIDRGETFAILGESGSGKSVTAAAIMGLVTSPPGYVTSGRCRFRGQDLLELSMEQRRRINGRTIAMIFQDPLVSLNPVYSVGWQIAETFRAHGTGTAEAARRAGELLERVGIPAERANSYPHQFSGGQRQRIMIAMAIALGPDLLIADEPTTALDVTVQAQILKLIRELQADNGMAVLLITHDLGVVAEVADRVAVMQDGAIVESGDVRRVFKNPTHDYTKRLLKSVPGQAPFIGRASGENEEVLFRGEGLQRHFPVKKGLFRRATGQVVRALDGVDFELRRGETLGIVGESGSGKSTLARTLLALDPPTGGTVSYRGEDLYRFSSTQMVAFRRRVQPVFQDPTASLDPRMKVGEIISEPWVVHAGVVPPAERPKRVAALLEQVGLDPAFAHRYPHQFSGGQRQRIAIARALALQPEVLICDEIVSALDVSIQAQVIELLKALRKDFGLSYVFIAHDLMVVRDFAERVIVMNRGSIVEEGPVDKVFGQPQHPYTQELLAASPIPDPDRYADRNPVILNRADHPAK